MRKTISLNGGSLLRRGSMGCYVYPLNEVSAGAKAEFYACTHFSQRSLCGGEIGELTNRRLLHDATTPLDCVTCLLRMPIWALAGVEPTESTTLVRAICRRQLETTGREVIFQSFLSILQVFLPCR